MNILVIGTKVHLQECSNKFGETHQYTLAEHHQVAKIFFKTADAVFDFVIEENRSQMEIYNDYLKGVVFLNTSLITLAKLTKTIGFQVNRALFGFCGMPTFLNRELLEVSLRFQQDIAELQRICKALNTDFVVVDDRVGLVTPRVICMIINEAYYAIQEEIATRQDIDIAMQLGTNYPFGPFEWCERIGIRKVWQLLDSVYHDTRDERYKICPLLEKEFLNTTQP